MRYLEAIYEVVLDAWYRPTLTDLSDAAVDAERSFSMQFTFLRHLSHLNTRFARVPTKHLEGLGCVDEGGEAQMTQDAMLRKVELGERLNSRIPGRF